MQAALRPQPAATASAASVAASAAAAAGFTFPDRQTNRKLPNIIVDKSYQKKQLSNPRSLSEQPRHLSKLSEKGSPTTPVLPSAKVSRVGSTHTKSSSSSSASNNYKGGGVVINSSGQYSPKLYSPKKAIDSRTQLPPTSIQPEIIEIIKEKLYWISTKNPPNSRCKAFYFCIDNSLTYEPFFADFGPNNLSCTYKFSVELDHQLQNPKFSSSKVFHFTGIDPNKRTNAAYLMGAYQIIMLGRSAEQAWRPFESIAYQFNAYRDASYGECTYKCTILDCLRGLEYGIKLKWFNLKSFNLTEYEYFERVENGDLNEVLPGKFIAFSGPSSTTRSPEGYRTFTPEEYVPIFKEMGVTLVIRLNTKAYDSSRFTNHGIKHLDLFFADGSCPPDNILEQFLRVCESEKGKIAVHCKAGLGRTGTLIAMYAMKHYHFSAADFIGWIRVVRPGSILGPQQFYLNQRQAEMWRAGVNSPIWHTIKHTVEDFGDLSTRLSSLSIANRGDISPEQLRMAVNGDKNQGEGLVGSKNRAVINATHRGEISPEQMHIAVNGEQNQGEGLVSSKMRAGQTGNRGENSPGEQIRIGETVSGQKIKVSSAAHRGDYEAESAGNGDALAGQRIKAASTAYRGDYAAESAGNGDALAGQRIKEASTAYRGGGGDHSTNKMHIAAEKNQAEVNGAASKARVGGRGFRR